MRHSDADLVCLRADGIYAVVKIADDGQAVIANWLLPQLMDALK